MSKADSKTITTDESSAATNMTRRAVLAGAAASTAIAATAGLSALPHASNDARLAALWQVFKRAWLDDVPDVVYPIYDEIVATPADGYSGIWVKIQVAHERMGGILDDDPHSTPPDGLITSIAADVKRLAGATS
jgi:hypothetical protein